MGTFGEAMFNTELKENSPLPEGDYNLTIKRVDMKKIDDERKIFEVGVQVIDGPSKGRMFSHGFWYEHTSAEAKRIGREQTLSLMARCGWVKKDDATTKDLELIESGRMHLITPDFDPADLVRHGATFKGKVIVNAKGYNELKQWKRYDGEIPLPAATKTDNEVPF